LDFQNEIIQNINYYPFGMNWEESNTVIGDENKYQFSGKEIVDELGLEWLDFGARWYDPAIARWSGVDPKADQFPHINTYNYAFNNPMNLVDPEGEAPIDPPYRIGPFQFSLQDNGILYVHRMTTSTRQTLRVTEMAFRFSLGSRLNFVQGVIFDQVLPASERPNGASDASQRAAISEKWNHMSKEQQDAARNAWSQTVSGLSEIQEYSYEKIWKSDMPGFNMGTISSITDIASFFADIVNEIGSNPTHTEQLVDLTFRIISQKEGVALMNDQTLHIQEWADRAFTEIQIVRIYQVLYEVSVLYDLSQTQDKAAFEQWLNSNDGQALKEIVRLANLRAGIDYIIKYSSDPDKYIQEYLDRWDF
jgi:RHS repeat-associated protein